MSDKPLTMEVIKLRARTWIDCSICSYGDEDERVEREARDAEDDTQFDAALAAHDEATYSAGYSHGHTHGHMEGISEGFAQGFAERERLLDPEYAEQQKQLRDTLDSFLNTINGETSTSDPTPTPIKQIVEYASATGWEVETTQEGGQPNGRGEIEPSDAREWFANWREDHHREVITLYGPWMSGARPEVVQREQARLESLAREQYRADERILRRAEEIKARRANGGDGSHE